MNFKMKAVRLVAAAGAILTMGTGVAFASIGNATVTADSLRLRSEANTSSDTVTMAPKGSEVVVEEDAGNGWYRVSYGDQAGYMSGEWLRITLEDGTVIEGEPTPLSDEPQQQRGLVTTSVLNIRSGPGTDYDKVGTLKAGTVVDIVADDGSGWYQIDSGYVSAEYVTPVSYTHLTLPTIGG